MTRFFICAGEASADSYGAALAEELGRLAPGTISVEGVGGARMRAAGVGLIEDSSTWGVVSIVQALRKVPRLALSFYRIKSALSKGAKGVFVPIDFGYMNIRLARFAKAKGWKVLYFVPPGSWRRDRQGRDLPLVTDAIVTPFSWSAAMLNGMGAKAFWFGHPIRQLLRGTALAGERRGIAVLPGSRGHEIEANLPLIAAGLHAGGWDVPIEFALAPSLDLNEVQQRWRSLTGRTGDLFTVGQTGAVLGRAEAAIVCSGTATLEAALCRCPMVVIYRLSKAMEMEIKLLRIKRPKYVALPNIFLDRAVAPELIGEDAKPEALASELGSLLADTPKRAEQLEAFGELVEMLGPDDAITKTAELALKLGVGAA